MSMVLSIGLCVPLARLVTPELVPSPPWPASLLPAQPGARSTAPGQGLPRITQPSSHPRLGWPGGDGQQQ